MQVYVRENDVNSALRACALRIVPVIEAAASRQPVWRVS